MTAHKPKATDSALAFHSIPSVVLTLSLSISSHSSFLLGIHSLEASLAYRPHSLSRVTFPCHCICVASWLVYSSPSLSWYSYSCQCHPWASSAISVKVRQTLPVRKPFQWILMHHTLLSGSLSTVIEPTTSMLTMPIDKRSLLSAGNKSRMVSLSVRTVGLFSQDYPLMISDLCFYSLSLKRAF